MGSEMCIRDSVLTEFPETQTSLLANIKSLDDRQAWEDSLLSTDQPSIELPANADSNPLTQKI